MRIGLAGRLKAACAAMVLSGVGGCAALPGRGAGVDFPVSTPQAALRPYYATIPDDALPVAPPTPAIDAGAPVTRVIVGSCIDEELDAPGLTSMAQEDADLTLLIGDNIYGDIDGRAYISNDYDLKEVREGYAELAAKPEFVALRAARPMLAMWDDHDYGANDAGRDFPFKEFSQRVFERFWGAGDEVAARPGVYSSMMAGPDGQRLQIILTDSRYFRSELTPTDAYGEMGRERYLPSEDPEQAMLGEAQWIWLEKELKKPADLRLLVSSIQVIPSVHGWEAWSTMPRERERLYELLAATGADNTVFVSGDRHTAFLYNNPDAPHGAVRELTASSVNKSFAKKAISPERDPLQIGDGYGFANYGAVDIDWDARQVTLSIVKEDGEAFSRTRFAF